MSTWRAAHEWPGTPTFDSPSTVGVPRSAVIRSPSTSTSFAPSWSGSSTKSFSVPWPLRNSYSGIEALGVVGLGVVDVELVERHPVGLDGLGDHGAPRHRRVGTPGVRLPQARPQECLPTVEE